MPTWKDVVKVRTRAEKLQKKGVETFNAAAKNGDTKGRERGQRLIQRSDTAFAEAARLAREVHKDAWK